VSYDVVVVGSGPGGATVARELARAGASVMVLERGSARPPSGRARQALSELWMPGRSLSVSGAPAREPVLVLRGVTLGGSSMYFFGTAWEPPYELLDPFGVDLRADADALRAELAPAVLPPELTGPRARILAQAALDLGHDWRPVPKFVDQLALAATGPSGYGAARWTARQFLQEAVAAGAVVRTDTRACRVRVNGGRVEGVEIAVGATRNLVRASTVVLAAGALGTPALLRSAGLEGAGRDWFYDPVVAVNGVLDSLDAGFEPPMCGGVHRAADGYMLTDLCRPRWVHEMLTLAAGRPDRLGAYRRTLSIMVKVRDELSGTVSTRGVAHKPLAAVDRDRLRRGEEAAREILTKAGALGLHSTARVAVHPGGTARIGDVLSADLAAVGVDGLYVCDASVLPTAWGVPPTFTILALARRLARHLGAEDASMSSRVVAIRAPTRQNHDHTG
jgi:choline dehydrogenase-like flavoprotein